MHNRFRKTRYDLFYELSSNVLYLLLSFGLGVVLTLRKEVKCFVLVEMFTKKFDECCEIIIFLE